TGPNATAGTAWRADLPYNRRFNESSRIRQGKCPKLLADPACYARHGPGVGADRKHGVVRLELRAGAARGPGSYIPAPNRHGRYRLSERIRLGFGAAALIDRRRE